MPFLLNMNRAVLVLVVLSTVATPVKAAYHLELEAHPAAAFPYLAKFGTVGLHVYDGGVRADTFWLDGFSRNASSSVTVLNPLARMYTEIPVSQIASMLGRLGGAGEVEKGAVGTLGPKLTGSVGRIPATRHRIIYGPTAWIDVWTTTAVPENAQLRSIVNQLVSAISPGTFQVWKKISGTPIHVELNFRRFQKVKLLTVKKLTPAADDAADGLSVGSFYVKAPLLDSLWK